MIILVVAGHAGHVIRGHRGVADHDRRLAGRAHAGHGPKRRTQLRCRVLRRERLRGRGHPPAGHSLANGALDQSAQRTRVPRAVGHRNTDASWHQHAAHFTHRGCPVWHVIEHVHCQHDVKHTVTHRQCSDISTEQRRAGH